MARFVCGWKVRLGERPPGRETVTELAGHRLGMAYHGFNNLPGEPDMMLVEYEVDAPNIDAAKVAAAAFGPAIRAALARYDGAGLTVLDLYEVRPAAN